MERRIQGKLYGYVLMDNHCHQNPVKAGICKRGEDYKWSSGKFYRKRLNDFIETKIIIEIIESGFNGKESSKKYKEIMDKIEETDYDKLNDIGNRAYEIMMKSSISTEKRLYYERNRLNFRSIWCISLEDVEG
ncbi:MAG TPA: hypothetical protein PLG67_03745 [Bacillota bacterium]|nr:hypothetical protein [Bacillota bacterium]HQL35690.1 hypothetical protein [Bacillota bacterium]HRS20392.1 hypothetical protein [Clostridia bacterium]HRU41872.1 hypothetical protein [Candidatus Diapherotrites archaeon]